MPIINLIIEIPRYGAINSINVQGNLTIRAKRITQFDLYGNASYNIIKRHFLQVKS